MATAAAHEKSPHPGPSPVQASLYSWNPVVRPIKGLRRPGV